MRSLCAMLTCLFGTCFILTSILYAHSPYPEKPPQTPYQQPSQGNHPHPIPEEIPLHLQHRDHMMTYPQPQRNPPGPRIHGFSD